MPFCKQCGNNVNVNDKFCAQCGMHLEFQVQIETNGEESSKKHFVDWRNREHKGKESFWQILKQSIRHTFSDNEEKLSTRRRVFNIFLGLIIIALIAWILAPGMDSIKIKVNDNQSVEKGCVSFEESKEITITYAEFNHYNLQFNAVIKNNQNQQITLTKIAKTYEFSLDGRGETEEEQVLMVIPKKQSLNLTFSLSKDPYIIGLYFDNCEKIKVLEWEVAT